ncbi:RNA polymerase sigma factor [Zavarzinella formosa]|uniref:RNA polymerase sigma factor n=1 Tax=Zavarzinella formosa TaxID=360055 RepID=UPI00030116EB|nr:sigma-70 family RNA polymerase sigma factor [Zavarzinella formosa]
MPGTPAPENGRLDAITTRWSLIRQAHSDGKTRDAETARGVLVLRYAKAVRGYVGGMLKNREDADELAQEVVVRLLKGDFAGADPTRGRFRDLLKTAARNMVRNHWEKQSRRRPVDADLGTVAESTAATDPWLASWQKTVLDHVWAALREVEKANPKNPAHTLMKLRTDFPNDSSEQLADKLGKKLGATIRADTCRQILRRGRLKFAELLIEEVTLGLDDPNPGRIEEELAALELLDYVRDFLPADWKQRGELMKE